MPEERTVSRREFLKIAGIAGATIGMGAGLGGLVAACGETEETTTTSAGATTTTAGATTTTAAASTTTVSAGAEEGRPIKFGYVSPQTGNFSVFAIADDWLVERTNGLLKDGIITGDGKKRMIEIIVKDSQSTTDRASQVAADLVQNDNVDILLASGTPDTANPVADQGEALGCPVLLSFSPWQALFFDPTGAPREFKWVYGNLLGSEETIASFTDAFSKSGVETNKKVGMLFQNDADYKGWMDPSAAPKVFAEQGYTLVVPDPYSVPAEDFTQQISMFKSEGCETHLRDQRPAVVLQLLDPEPAAGLPAQVHQLGQGPPLPAGRGVLSQQRPGAHRRVRLAPDLEDQGHARSLCGF